MRAPHTRPRRGAVLVEFALVALAFYLLLAGIVTFGMILHSAQVAQDAARLAARELALVPLPATATFEQALQNTTVRQRVFDPNLLVIDLDAIPGGDLDAYVATLPAVNRALRPAMIYDQIGSGGGAKRLLRVPGALVASASAPSGYTVAVPRVIGRDAQGRETIEWVGVVEEVRRDRSDPTTGPFSVAATDENGVLLDDRGLVAVRVNIPSQSPAMGSARPSGSHADPNLDETHLADDAGVSQQNLPPGTLAGGRNAPGFNAYDGPYGLGRVQMQGKEVRPYRRVTTAQAFFRREVFAEQSQQ